MAIAAFPLISLKELLRTLEDHSIDALEVIGFRGSAKSIFASTAYVLYAALIKPELYPFI